MDPTLEMKNKFYLLFRIHNKAKEKVKVMSRGTVERHVIRCTETNAK